MVDAVSEKERRLNLWHSLSQEDLDDVEPKKLRELGIYGGAQGIWVDKAHTASSDIGADGATVSVLHTGRHYDDDLPMMA
jgi:putative restriction endonuclease